MRDVPGDIQRILTSIKEYLLFEEGSGLDWLNIPKGELCPLVFKALKGAVGRCTKCGLSAVRTNAVFGEGNPDARLMFIGEAPGADEDMTGRPFIGRAGELLTKIIQAIDLKREDVFITSVVKCHPPENRTPTNEEITSCRQYLLDQIILIDPEIICTLGSIASQTILETDEPITKLRGRCYKFKGISVIPTFHPAYLLRNPGAKRQVWEDMQLLKALY